jgi:hypothetical protein
MEGSVDIGWGFGDFISDYYYENFEFWQVYFCNKE